MSMHSDSHTLNEQQLSVGDGHVLYSQLWGNSDSDQRFIFLHGGPGSGLDDKHKSTFNPATHQVLFFDQRGSGQSTPFASTENNTTDYLLADITHLADFYDFESFGLVGRSWGSCLGLIYSIRNQSRVKRLDIGGVFTARQQELDYFYKGGYRHSFPDVWDNFLASAPAEQQNRVGDYHLETVIGPDKILAQRSAHALGQTAMSLLSVNSIDGVMDIGAIGDVDFRKGLLQYYYDANHGFIPENYIMDNVNSLTMPVSIVQGRYDTVCPPITAYEVAQRIIDCKIIWTSGGHNSQDPQNIAATRQVLGSDI